MDIEEVLEKTVAMIVSSKMYQTWVKKNKVAKIRISCNTYSMATVFSTDTPESHKEKFSPASKFIELVTYEEKTRTMEIHFHSGTVQKYMFVFPSVYFSFKQSPSHDAYFSKAIKGRLMSVKIQDGSHGRKKSAPLQKVKKENTLDDGLRKQNAQRERIRGTVARAFGGAGL